MWSMCIEVMGIQGVIRLLHFYNPCSELLDILKSATGEFPNQMVICGDFNCSQ